MQSTRESFFQISGHQFGVLQYPRSFLTLMASKLLYRDLIQKELHQQPSINNNLEILISPAFQPSPPCFACFSHLTPLLLRSRTSEFAGFAESSHSTAFIINWPASLLQPHVRFHHDLFIYTFAHNIIAKFSHRFALEVRPWLVFAPCTQVTRRYPNS